MTTKIPNRPPASAIAAVVSVLILCLLFFDRGAVGRQKGRSVESQLVEHGCWSRCGMRKKSTYSDLTRWGCSCSMPQATTQLKSCVLTCQNSRSPIGPKQRQKKVRL